MEEIEHEEMKIDTLENALLHAEYKYKSDITLLQEALLRTKQLENLHLMALHLKFKPILKNCGKLPIQYRFYKWKSNCSIDRTNRIKKVAKLLRYLYKKNMTKAFLLFRERGNRMQMEKLFNPGFRDFSERYQDI